MLSVNNHGYRLTAAQAQGIHTDEDVFDRVS